MAVGKDIRGKISSIRNTQKITKAMELVAASKMRRTQERMTKGKPYTHLLRRFISHVAESNSEFQHSWFAQRAVKKVGYIIVSTDRGLCGGLNINLFRMVLEAMVEHEQHNVSHQTVAIGRKALAMFQKTSNVVASRTQLPDVPQLDHLLATIKIQLDAFNNGEIDSLYLASNDFVNSMVQKPKLTKLLPLEADKNELLTRSFQWDYLYEPNAEVALNELLRRYIEALVYQAVIENIACEQAARMLAMKSATDNAGELIDQLLLAYNKARQAAITQEISEIVGGASAL